MSENMSDPGGDDQFSDPGGDNQSFDYDDLLSGGGGHSVSASGYVWVVGGSILLAVGTAGNLMSLLVLTRPSIRRTNAAVYLIVVALTDLCALYTGLLRQVIIQLTGRDLREDSELSCKLHTALVYFFLDYSAWLLAALSLERLFSVCWPHRVRHRCTHRTSAFIISAVGVFLLAVNAHFLVIMGDLTLPVPGPTSSITLHCVPLTEAYYTAVSSVWPWVDLSVFSLLPLLTHVVCNVFIVKRVLDSFRQSRRDRIRGGPAVVATVKPRIREGSAADSGELANGQGRGGREGHGGRGQGQSGHGHVSSMTVMLVAVSCVFCVTTLPICVYNIVNWILVDRGIDAPHREMAWAVVNVLMYSNNAVNFVLYSLTGSRFRAELLSLCRALRSRLPCCATCCCVTCSASALTTSSMTSSASRAGSSSRDVAGKRWSSTQTDVSSV